MRSGFRKKWDDFDLLIESKYRKLSYRKKARIRLKRMNGGYKCDEEYKKIVLPYWKKYGYKPSKMWYQIFAEKNNKVDPRYIPDDLYYGELVPYFSNSQFRRFGEDKCYHNIWFADVKRPDTLCKNIAGVFYDADMNIIDFENAVAICMNYREQFLIKPSIDSGEGRLITFYVPEKFDIDDIRTTFRKMKANFVVQASVKQHDILSKMNPSSLNTVRIVSFLFEGKVHILSAILRIGAKDAKVDNIGAGGFAVPIQNNGQLNERGVNRKAEWRSENNYGIRFADVKIPNFEEIIKIIKREHYKLAHFKLIGWDFAIDVNANPVFIEYNVCPGANQVTCGPTFGELTDKVLEEYFIKRTLEKSQN